MSDRVALLERYGRVYGELKLAVTFTRAVEGEDAKRCGTGWDETEPLADGPFAAALLKGRGVQRNPVVVLRPSGLIGLECDTAEGLEQIRALDLPSTVTVQSSAPERLHFWYRPANGKTDFVAFRFEKAGITADKGRYLLIPPALHPSGRVYEFLRSPEDTEIAVLPSETYDQLVQLAKKDELEQRERLRGDPTAKITEGQRRETIFRFACSQRAFGVPPDAIVTAAQALNRGRCEPPLTEAQVATQVKGALEYEPGTVAATGVPSEIAWQQLPEVEMQSIIFVDKPLFQGSAFHIIGGRKGVGKGTVIANSSARVTRGELGPKRSVIWIASEDSAAIDIKPRVVAADGDPARVTVVKSGWVQLPRDIDEIRRKMSDIGDVGLLIIDPVGNHIAGKESNSETDIRDAIAPLNQLADDYESMVFGVRHLTEKECGGGLAAALLGSSAWAQVPRAVIAVVRDNEDPQVSHVRCILGNRLPAGTPSRMFRIEGVLLPGLENEVTRGTWVGDSSKDIEEIFAKGGDKRPSKSAAARELILDVLESEGDQESDALDARVARETGIAAKTVRNLRGELKNEGLVKAFVLERNDDGTARLWGVGRTQAPRDGGEK